MFQSPETRFLVRPELSFDGKPGFRVVGDEFEGTLHVGEDAERLTDLQARALNKLRAEGRL